MPNIAKKYEQLVLEDDYLTDSLLMTLAWKKSHQYIRTANWYADNFELDLSALSLLESAKQWCSDLQKDELTFQPLELVPAPKQHNWEFKKTGFSSEECLTWKPKNKALDEYNQNSEEIKKITEKPADIAFSLRPLAHMPIREQSMMTLLMMCIGNQVETRQGDPCTELEFVHEKKVVSYGNRLYCRYDEQGNAEHSYGGTTTYSKFFVDNRKFLERPFYFAKKARTELDDNHEVFILDLDLAKFFDLVNRKKLCELIKTVASVETKPVGEVKHLNKLLAAFEAWEWSEQAAIEFNNVCKNEEVMSAPKGIPQGLVAGGFLANVYMLEFDENFRDLIGSILEPTIRIADIEVTLVDYCRYVDDMRLVVSATPKVTDTPISKFDVEELVIATIKEVIKKSKLNDLKLNDGKTKIQRYQPRVAGISKELTHIQQKLSGPIAFDESQETLGQIESLLSIVASDQVPEQDDTCTPNRLAQINKSELDVRDDTIKRFAANKISKLLKGIRNFSAHEVDTNGDAIAGDWDYLQERLARRLIAAWSHDPSLVLLLKKGLELYPCSRILEPVLDQLNKKLAEPELKIQAVARYCLSEVFRHSAIVIDRLDPKYIPLHAKYDEYFEHLQHHAMMVCHDVGDSGGNFDLLLEQAQFLLLCRRDSNLEERSTNADHDMIIKLIKGFREISFDSTLNASRIAANVLLAAQLSDDNKLLNRSVSCVLAKLPPDVCLDILTKIASQNLSLFIALIRHARSLSVEWAKQASIKVLAKQYAIDRKALLGPLEKISGDKSLLSIIQRVDNPFANEVMLLKLMLSLLEEPKQLLEANTNQLIDVIQTKVALEDISYHRTPQQELFNSKLKVSLALTESQSHLSPHLAGESPEISAIQKIAICARTALVGNLDWSGFGSSIPTKLGYRGIKTSQDKRSLGMMNTPQSIFGESAQVSHWLTTLISKLLIWPGINVNDQGYTWPNQWTINSVKNLIDQRLSILEKMYCTHSKMPSLIESVTLDWNTDKRELTVAMVQSKLPRINDFDCDWMLNDIKFRSIHRRHVADVAALVCKHIDAQRVTDEERNERGKKIDLIVWPELSVHRDDMDILIALSRKSHAIIYAGLVYIEQEGVKGPNNCAVWIVPPKANTNQKELIRFQGKQNMMSAEKDHIQPWRPYQLMLELKHPRFPNDSGFMLTGAICYDATDISLSADLRDKSNAYIVCALNKDVNTFDTMIDALHYHMFQPVVLVNSGEYGGSCAKAPYSEPYHRLIAHSHGNNQVSINTFEMNMYDFRRDDVGKGMKSDKTVKTQPAGVMMQEDKE
ncbi:RNA-directed DNA polymerase [Photobacterium leiognathi]|uniref:RNA-directed DNA polymerase n=1 Tax=Photobacterium leiognathi TaxID=553611 RepID=UPI0029819568|nr:RNA-directed DNA polymerase [Photobacterium leiognathi]